MILPKHRMQIRSAINQYTIAVSEGKTPSLRTWSRQVLEALVPTTDVLLDQLQLPVLDDIPEHLPKSVSAAECRTWLERNVGTYISYLALLLETNVLFEQIPDLAPNLVHAMVPLVTDGNFARRVLLGMPYKLLMSADAGQRDEVLISLDVTNESLTGQLDRGIDNLGLQFSPTYAALIFNLGSITEQTVVSLDDVVVGEAMTVEQMARTKGWNRRFLKSRIWINQALPTPEKKLIAGFGAVVTLLLCVILLRSSRR